MKIYLISQIPPSDDNTDLAAANFRHQSFPLTHPRIVTVSIR